MARRIIYPVWNALSGRKEMELDMSRAWPGYVDFEELGVVHRVPVRYFREIVVVDGPVEEAALEEDSDGSRHIVFCMPGADETPYKSTYAKFRLDDISPDEFGKAIAGIVLREIVRQDAYLIWRACDSPIIGGGTDPASVVCEVALCRIGDRTVPEPAIFAATEGVSVICYVRYTRRFVLREALHRQHPLKGRKVDGAEAIARYLEEQAEEGSSNGKAS